MGIDLVGIVIEVEEQFDLSMPEDVWESLTTVGKLHAWVMGELHRLDRQQPAEDVFEQIREITANVTGVDRGLILPQSKFVEDLLAD